MVKDVSLLKQPGCWLRSSHSFKECVIAHWSSGGAPKIIGAKLYTEVWEYGKRIGRGAMYGGRSVNGSGRGRHTRENAGISSENVVRNYVVESLRFPGEGSSTQG